MKELFSLLPISTHTHTLAVRGEEVIADGLNRSSLCAVCRHTRIFSLLTFSWNTRADTEPELEVHLCARECVRARREKSHREKQTCCLYPMLMTTGKCRDLDSPVNRQLRFPTELPLYHNRSVQVPHDCSPNLFVNLSLPSPLTQFN